MEDRGMNAPATVISSLCDGDLAPRLEHLSKVISETAGSIAETGRWAAKPRLLFPSRCGERDPPSRVLQSTRVAYRNLLLRTALTTETQRAQRKSGDRPRMARMDTDVRNCALREMPAAKLRLGLP